MLAAIEAIPFSESDRRDSERMLRTLAAGGAVDRIATRAAPPLPDGFTQPIPVPQRRSKRRPLVWTGLAGAAILAALVGWWGRGGLTPRAEPPAVRGDTAQRPAPATLRPVAGQATLAPGRLRMLTTPPDAEILIDDRRVGIGSVFDLDVPSGTRQLRVRAPGYRTFDTTIIVVPGHTVTLGRIALRSVGGGA
jgi:hypothetical protein